MWPHPRAHPPSHCNQIMTRLSNTYSAVVAVCSPKLSMSQIPLEHPCMVQDTAVPLPAGIAPPAVERQKKEKNHEIPRSNCQHLSNTELKQAAQVLTAQGD